MTGAGALLATFGSGLRLGLCRSRLGAGRSHRLGTGLDPLENLANLVVVALVVRTIRHCLTAMERMGITDTRSTVLLTTLVLTLVLWAI